jgi:hypothetical protein
MTIEFYNVRKKIKVSVAEEDVTAVEYKNVTKTGKKTTRYGLKAVDEDGTKLTKFCNKEAYDKLA